MGVPDPPEELAAAIAVDVEAMAAAWRRIEELVDGWPDPPQALLGAERATAAVAALELPGRGLRLRGRAARRWRVRDDLSLSGLGDELGELGLGEEGKDHKPLAAKLVAAGEEEGVA